MPIVNDNRIIDSIERLEELSQEDIWTLFHTYTKLLPYYSIGSYYNKPMITFIDMDVYIKKFVMGGLDLDYGGQSALHDMLLIGKIETIDWLIKGGANVNAVTKYGQTPLHRAIEYCASLKDFNIIKLLIDSGAFIEVLDNEGRKPISEAYDWGVKGIPIVKTLLQAGADLELMHLLKNKCRISTKLRVLVAILMIYMKRL